MPKGTKPAQLTAIGLEPVLKPATCRAAGAHGFKLRGVALHREEHDLLAGHFGHVLATKPSQMLA